ncbi:MAG: N-acetylglucosamine kinase [Devosia sp.]
MRDGTIIGIDGGGSKTLVAAADSSGRVTALSRGKATSPLESKSWGAALAEQVQAYAGRADLLAVGAGLPAHGEVEHISAAQCRVIAELFGSVPQRVMNDVDAAHIGAFAGGPGILILAGTGSMAWARDAAGASHRTGGWGETIGDEGSGYWIGRQVLGAVSKSVDGRGPATGLVDAVIELLGLDGGDKVNALEGWVSHFTEPRTQIASLAPVALRLAEAGDAAALAIVERAADELALHVRTLERRLDAPTMSWSYAGGLFSSPALRRATEARLGRAPNPPRLPPIGGALLAAAQHLGWQPDEAWIGRLAASLAALPAPGGDAKPQTEQAR